MPVNPCTDSFLKEEGHSDNIFFKFCRKAREQACVFQESYAEDRKALRNLGCNESKTFGLDVKMIVIWELACCLRLELERSRAFQRGFIWWLSRHILEDYHQFYSTDKDHVVEGQRCSVLEGHTDLWIKDISLHVKKIKARRTSYDRISLLLIVQNPTVVQNLEAELKWSCLLLPLVHQKFCLEYILAFLSTLGGAYSSLGELSASHAKVAGNISLKQLTVASKLGNPILASHCRLYHAHSLMQTGQLKSAATIIRHEYTIANFSVGKYDPKLLICCKAAWARLRYFQEKKRDVM